MMARMGGGSKYATSPRLGQYYREKQASAELKPPAVRA